MNGYVLNINMRDSNTAASKPVQDVTDVLVRNGFSRFNYDHTNSRFRKLFVEPLKWKHQLRSVPGTNFIFQYPVYSHFMMNIMIKDLSRRKDIYKVGFIHDIESLRFDKDNSKKIGLEIHLLNQFNCLIVHNEKMKAWLVENGIKVPMVSLQIFDFLNSVSMDLNRDKSGPIVFAGNLSKAPFLSRLNIKTSISLMGPNPLDTYPSNIHYEGQYTSEDLPNHLKGSFGLVWDGISPDTGEGALGEYTKYNNPHKVSLYLSSGLPVIVWEKAAIAQFVSTNNLGLVVDSLSKIDEIIQKCSEDEYTLMLKSVQRVGESLREGKFTMNAVKSALQE
ncbi:beta-1,6-galactofuranosyltransferase [Secundilactobacillus pentosiphilus]|uniref:Beta-1,6-galactofuranosyltransferase n=1 Tax=Secundilactobacillus pentosiphilus TaxID=1714682 RepID=A0A1Z5ISV7_9LACO|nr:sugar transferase [Secundilactobacillus pentosiphilus]GAX04672.1 beta-1,6-galactofuranosyltransferase [Secundilactobacillus pentosiphilus]